MRKIDTPFAIALGASCALHTVAAAYLPDITAQASAPQRAPVTVTLKAPPPAPVTDIPRASPPPVRVAKIERVIRRVPSPPVRRELPAPEPFVVPAPSVPVVPMEEPRESRQREAPIVVAAVAPPAVAVESRSVAVDAAPKIELPRFDVAYLQNPPPAYPAIARRMRLEGTVVLRVLVDALGHAEELRIGKTSGAAILDEAALGAVRDWRFVPARQGPEAIAHWVDVPVRFRFQD